MNTYKDDAIARGRLAQLHETSRKLLGLATDGVVDTASDALLSALASEATREDAIKKLSTALEELQSPPSLVDRTSKSSRVYLKPTSVATLLCGVDERKVLFEIMKLAALPPMTMSEMEMAACSNETLRLSFRKVLGGLKQAGFIEKGRPKSAVIVFPQDSATDHVQAGLTALNQFGIVTEVAPSRVVVTFRTNAKTDPIKLAWRALRDAGLPVPPADRRTKVTVLDEVSIDEIVVFTLKPSSAELAAAQRVFDVVCDPEAGTKVRNESEVQVPEGVEDGDIAWAMTNKEGGLLGLFRARYEDVSQYKLTPLGQGVRALSVAGSEVRTATQLHIDVRARRRRPIPHPYVEFVAGVRRQLYALGFKEMRGPIVESEFWNCDALFMPQNHSARDIHDTIHPRRPSVSRPLPQAILERVSAVHERGGNTGSLGWQYQFNIEQTQRLMLRSQGTAVSARTLASGVKPPAKYFAIARVFRRDQVDATHHYEFNQLEGIVVDENANLGMLLGLLSMFGREFAKAEDVKFTPGYFPFTEPSVEVAVKVGGAWIEMGGAGLFRQELTRPLGVAAPVIAWGLGLDRMAMSALKMNDLRPLFDMSLGALSNPVEARRQLVVRQFALSQRSGSGPAQANQA